MAATGGILAGKAYVKLYTDSSDYVRGLRTAEAKLNAFGTKMKTLGTSMVGLSASVLAPLALTVKASSDMQETMNKFDVVFGKNSDAVKAWGDEYGKQVGRSKQQVADFLASSQDLFVPMGFDASTAEEMSKTVTKLAVDLASFNNTADADALRDLQAALTGSGEVMKKYGVIVSEAAVKQELLKMSLDPKTVTEAEKAQARLNIILRGTAAAQGDAIRSASGLANQVKAMKAAVDDASVAIGDALLPILTPLVGHLVEGAEAFGQWAADNQAFIATIAEVAAGLGAAGISMVAFGSAAKGMASAVHGASAALTFLSAHPAFLALAAIVASYEALATVVNETNESAIRASYGLDHLAGAEVSADASSQQLRKALDERIDTMDRLARAVKEVADSWMTGSKKQSMIAYLTKELEKAKAEAEVLLERLNEIRTQEPAGAPKRIEQDEQERMMGDFERREFEKRVKERIKKQEEFEDFQKQAVGNTQNIEDQTKRQQIENTYRSQLPGDRARQTRLDYEKNVALLALEKKQAYRDSTQTGVSKAKIDELFNARRKSLDFDYADALASATKASVGTYSASSAFRLGMGGKVDDKSVRATKEVKGEVARGNKVLENIEKNTRAKGMGR
jgi:hypothetical protein